MALIVETGAGLATAESYATVAEASAYCAKRGLAAWDSISDQEVALRLGTDFMQQCFRLQWAGTRATAAQALDWPRYSVPLPDAPGGGSMPAYVAYNTIPDAIKYACIELAVRTADGPLLLDLEREVIAEQVGPIHTRYAPGASRQTQYEAASRWLVPYFGSARGRGGVQVVRA